MSQQIIEQPDGRFAIWSSAIDDFTHVDCSVDEIVDALVEEARAKIIEKVNRTIGDLHVGGKPYHQFTNSFEECIDIIRETHGEDSDSLKHFGL